MIELQYKKNYIFSTLKLNPMFNDKNLQFVNKGFHIDSVFM